MRAVVSMVADPGRPPGRVNWFRPVRSVALAEAHRGRTYPLSNRLFGAGTTGADDLVVLATSFGSIASSSQPVCSLRTMRRLADDTGRANVEEGNAHHRGRRGRSDRPADGTRSAAPRGRARDTRSELLRKTIRCRA